MTRKCLYLSEKYRPIKDARTAYMLKMLMHEKNIHTYVHNHAFTYAPCIPFSAATERTARKFLPKTKKRPRGVPVLVDLVFAFYAGGSCARLPSGNISDYFQSKHGNK